MSESNPLKQSRVKLFLTIATIIALAGLIYGLRKDIGGVIDNLRKVNTLALLLMIPIMALSNDADARFFRNVFATLGQKVRYWPMFRMNLELNFVNHILPSGGISGISYFNVRMRGEGVSGAKSTLAQVVKLFLLYASFQPLLVLGVFLLAVRGHVNGLILVVASSLITLLIVGTFIGLYIIESRQRINSFLTFMTKAINRLIHFFRPHKPETIGIKNAQKTFNELHENYEHIKNNWRELKKPFFYMMVTNASEVAAIYVVYIAFGRLVNVGAVILAYAVANFAGLISVLPAGIGIYEGLMTAVLVATGIPAELSIPVTIMYRVVNMALQLTPGYYFYQQAVKQGLTSKI
ncbi:MAG TPA: lysylphosphatidylglycerol synthase transmembrane domain-containing protein [Candidatus Nitrosopolaris sp.]|nr:lysylphosphatidylglycerol synthase transmembrane domain-containing protein [Candidatus Nitrosopolaris sp.]